MLRINFLLIQYFIVVYGKQLNSIVQTIGVSNWDNTYAINEINKNCHMNQSTMKCYGSCLNGKSCQIMKNFDKIVCGCFFCRFNKTEKKCVGQCSNTILQTCVSKVYFPKKSSDCVCTSCTSSWNIVKTTPSYFYNNYEVESYVGQRIPSCDDRTCYPGNSCSFFFISKDREVVNDTLFCHCNNNNPQQINY